ncbi:dolichol kinase KNAG_0M02080 [Huiozyma naganishii CBS 8797]|uniref:dolichol kinase n=1 Tax=Huiozyma naganishii (strain ATCC MYA-139 / BCRC 22969 / CBS 8797 / KCTC 17520 / NBRC 10181 / NCYC 3082 / Yp74L-3) TaxID=1071383 RepID=J7SBI0_HUIN7|nr:hypothetical protein KNAG_0M02080 [Kazachstania naganishii CBS 8797]CCK73061.1 hypothetical protein KNAG_0M02080 [Kazachstania naganishii CBS 8797]
MIFGHQRKRSIGNKIITSGDQDTNGLVCWPMLPDRRQEKQHQMEWAGVRRFLYRRFGPRETGKIFSRFERRRALRDLRALTSPPTDGRFRLFTAIRKPLDLQCVFCNCDVLVSAAVPRICVSLWSMSQSVTTMEGSKPVVQAPLKTPGQPADAMSLPFVVQSMILFCTLHIAYDKFGAAPFLTVGFIALYILVQLCMMKRMQFEIVYVFYLPFMFSLLFNQDLLQTNLLLSINVLGGPVYTRLASQLFLTMCLLAGDVNPMVCLLAVFVNMGFCFVLSKVSRLESLDFVDCNIFSLTLTNVLFLEKVHKQQHSLPYEVLWGTLAAFLCTVAINYILATIVNNNKLFVSIMVPVVFLVCFPLLTNTFIDSLPELPVIWLYHYITASQTRMRILGIWLLFLMVLIPNVLLFKSNFSLNTSRKIWHFLILLLVMQPFSWDPTFVKIALSGTIVLFLAVEYVRYLKLQPFGRQIDEKLRSFADFRDDRGPIIISYVYLILGISTPLLIFDSPVGLIALGAGDSMASIIGKRVGKWKWSGMKKTVEGTAAFILSTFIIGVIAKWYLGYFKDLTVSNWFVVCFLSGVLEGNSDLNDNILIPVFMLICEQLFTVA